MKNLNFLLPETKALLLELEKTSDFLNNFILVGGSAIALYHITFPSFQKGDISLNF